MTENSEAEVYKYLLAVSEEMLLNACPSELL